MTKTKKNKKGRSTNGGSKKNVHFEASVKPVDENARIFHHLLHDTTLVRSDIRKYKDAVKLDKKMTKKYEDMITDSRGSARWLENEDPKFLPKQMKLFKSIHEIVGNTTYNSKLGGRRRSIHKRKRKSKRRKRKRL